MYLGATIFMQYECGEHILMQNNRNSIHLWGYLKFFGALEKCFVEFRKLCKGGKESWTDLNESELIDTDVMREAEDVAPARF